jgi:oligopeptide/dipeptide ABC transporter ATP-binding protein
VNAIFSEPQHPYTWGLLGSLPRLDENTERLAQIPGQPPSLLRPPSGCRFHPRCAYVMDMCRTTEPDLDESETHAGHLERCWLDQPTRDREGSRIRESRFAKAT